MARVTVYFKSKYKQLLLIRDSFQGQHILNNFRDFKKECEHTTVFPNPAMRHNRRCFTRSLIYASSTLLSSGLWSQEAH